MDYKLFLTFTVLSTIVLTLITYKSAFINGKPHCNNFVTNVYLYLACAIALSACFVHIYNIILNTSSKRGILFSEIDAFIQIYPYMWLAIIVSFISIIILSIQDVFSKDGTLLNHSVWLVFLASISLTIYPIFKSKELHTIVQKSLLATILIFLIMSGIVYAYPEFFATTYKKVMTALLIALIAIIITELFLILTGTYDRGTYNIISFGVIALFSLYVSYDTSRIFDYAKKCIDSPNYPKVSTRLFLDVLNIFMRIVGVSRRN